MELSRREILKLGLFGSAALLLPAERMARTELALVNRIPQSRLPTPFSVPFAQPPVLAPAFADASTAYYDIAQRQVKTEILPGLQTTIWGYNGITPGPTIVTHRGQGAVVRQVNQLPGVHPTLRYNVWTSTHLHGAPSLPEYDGYASDITPPGQYKDYQYPSDFEAHTLWYHDHGVHITAPNAYMGLAAMYIHHDAHELALPIPHGAYDVPLIIKDAMFESSGELIFDDSNTSGVFGDVILVNGRPWPLMDVEPRKYRFRLLNASVSRSYDLALDTGDPLTVIATDGGLVPRAQPVSHLRFGMAERYEVVIDFAKYRPGQRVVLKNLRPDNNQEFANTDLVMAFRVGSSVTDAANNEVPANLNPASPVMALGPADAQRTRRFRFERDGGQWTINGTTWDDVVNSDYQLVVASPEFGDVEIWELENSSGGWFHPVHIHLVEFRILDRNGRPPFAYELGPKDVAYVGEHETVRVIMRFDHQVGRYMMHCHNLVHEDHDMMTQFAVGLGGHDPRLADPCRNLPAGRLFPEPDHGGDGDGGSATPVTPLDGPRAATPGGPAAPVPNRAAPPKRKPRHRRAAKPKHKHAVKPKPKPKPKAKVKHRAKPKRRRRRS